jgi:hypothetical protein
MGSRSSSNNRKKNMFKFLTDPTSVTWADVTVFYTTLSRVIPELTGIVSMTWN